MADKTRDIVDRLRGLVYEEEWFEEAAEEIVRLRNELDDAVRAVREWHGIALDMRDMSITGKGDIQDYYFNAAMRMPFYGAGSDPLPSKQVRPETNKMPGGNA